MQKFKTTLAAIFAICSSIIGGAMTSVSAAEFGDAFVQIQDSTTKDPAGAQLMVISIGILVTMVLAIFTVTMVYISKGSKKSRPRTEFPD